MAGAKNLTRLNVALTLSTGSFGKSMLSAGASVEQFANRMRNAMLGAIGPITAALSAGAFVAGIKSASERIDGLAKSADKLGVTTQSLAGLRLAADESGSSAEALEGAMAKLQNKVAEAASGNKEAAATFTALKLSADELLGLSADEQFGKVADAINGVGNASQRTATLMDVFGKSGTDLSGVIAGGSAGFKQAAIDADKLGLAVSRVDAFKVEEANDAFGRIGMVVEGVFNTLTIKLAPFITEFSKAFTDASTETNGFGSTIDAVISGAIKVVGFFADAWQGISLGFQAARVAAEYVRLGITSAMDSAYRSVEWLAIKFGQAFDLMVATASVLWNSLKVGWAAMKVPVFEFVQFAAGQMATLLETASKVAYKFSAAQGVALQEAAAGIRASTGAMGAEAEKELARNVAGLKIASKNVADSTTALFSSVQTEGSLMLTILKNDFAALADEESAKLQDMRNQPLASDRIKEAAARIQAEAEKRAQDRQTELNQKQAHEDAKNQIETEGVNKMRGHWLEYYDWKNSTEAQNVRQGLSSSSSFFGNLAKLQESHSKKAQIIGTIAAKAKIVTDTASAAMASYAALAGIPIVGPGLGAAAAAAAIAAGAVQLGNVDNGSIGGSSTGPADTSTTNIGGVQAPNTPGQTLVLQGDSFSAESLVMIFKNAKEQGYTIEGVRRE